MPPLEGKVAGRSNYQSFYPRRLHSLALCQPKCKGAHSGGGDEDQGCRPLSTACQQLPAVPASSSRYSSPPSAWRHKVKGRGSGEKACELALVLVTARRNVFSKYPITRFDKQPSMHMSVRACATCTRVPMQPTAIAIHPVT